MVENHGSLTPLPLAGIMGGAHPSQQPISYPEASTLSPSHGGSFWLGFKWREDLLSPSTL